MPSRSNRVVSALLAVALLASGPYCFATDKPDPNRGLKDIAAQHVDTAYQAAERSDIQLAEIEYRAALAIVERFDPRDPEAEAILLNNLSRMNEKLGNFSTAIDQAKRMLEKSSALDLRERDEHEGRIKRMTSALQQAKSAPQPGPSPQSAERPAKATPRPPLPVGGIVLAAVGGGLIVASIGCAAALPAATDRLQGSLTLPEIDSFTSQARTLQGLAIGFGAAGVLAGIGGAVWIVKWKQAHPMGVATTGQR